MPKTSHRELKIKKDTGINTPKNTDVEIDLKNSLKSDRAILLLVREPPKTINLPE